MTAFAPPIPELASLSPGRVCIIKPSALGDVVNAFPALASLRTLWPQAEIVWVVNTALRGLVDGHPHIDRVLDYDRKKAGSGLNGFRNFGRFLKSLRRERFDLTIDLQGLLRSGLMTAATGAPVRVGLRDAREGATWFYTHRVVPPGTRESAAAVDRLLSVARAFGGDVSDPSFAVAASSMDRAWARSVLEGLPRPRVALNLGARWETKRWPPRHFAELARRAVETYGAGLVAVGAPEDRPAVEELAERLAPIPLLDLCGRTTLPQLAALAEVCDLVISNDTGPLHLAVAAGARVVGVYTCTSALANGPYGPLALAAESQVWCKASYRVTCPRLECMSELGPETVWPLVEAQLDRARGSGDLAA
ncbi:MAG: glycosyltransferase family 9 protein [Isosphaeraceae bacterium]